MYDNTLIKALAFGGKEYTYQAWNGLTAEELKEDRKQNPYTYNNETDNYQQDHYQIHFNHEFSSSSNLHFALHHTYGRGYYEQYRKNDNLTNYFDDINNLFDGSVPNSDIVRRRWLNNNFSGITYSFNKKQNKGELNIGGAYNVYKGGLLL